MTIHGFEQRIYPTSWLNHNLTFGQQRLLRLTRESFNETDKRHAIQIIFVLPAFFHDFFLTCHETIENLTYWLQDTKFHFFLPINIYFITGLKNKQFVLYIHSNKFWNESNWISP